MRIFCRISTWILVLTTSVYPVFLLAQNSDCDEIGITTNLNFVSNMIPADVNPGQEFCIEFTSENFDAIVGFQFTMNFDPTNIQFVSFTDNQSLLIDNILPNLQEADNGILTFLWFNFATTGLSLPDNSLIFTLCFRAGSDPDECIPIGITNALAPLFPETEVNYQLSEQEKCNDDIITLDGNSSTCIEINCTSLSITDLQVCNSNTGQGSISFALCGGTPPYQYSLESNNIVLITGTLDNDFESLVPPFNNLPARTYFLRVTDAMGVEIVRPIIIDPIEAVTYDPPIVEDPVCANISNGSISVQNITSGLPGELFSVSFSNGITFQGVSEASIERLFNGDYSFTITDTNGCETEESVSLFTPPLELDIDLTPASCFGSDDGAISVVASGGTPFNVDEYRYNNVISQSFETLTPYSDNAFNNITNLYRLRVQDSNGCSLEENIEIPVLQEIEVDITDIQDVICKGDCTASLTLNVLTPGRYTFLVRDENNEFVFLGGNNGQSLFYNSELCAGRYSVLVRDTSGCAKDTFFEINEPAIELDAIPDAIMASCNSNDGQARLVVSGGMSPYTFNWADDPGDTDNTLENVLPGIYDVTVTDDLGCSIESSVEVESGAELEIEARINQNLECDGSGTGEMEAVIVSSSAANHGFIWSDENNTVLAGTPTLEFTGPGTYIINVMAVGNDCEATDTIIIDPIPGINFDISSQAASCAEASDGSINIENFSGGVAPYDCIWADNTIDSCNPTNLAPGIYMVTIIDADNCETDTFVEIEFNDIDIDLDIVVRLASCPGENDASISLENISGGTAPYVCEWEQAGISSCNPIGLSAGTYNFSIIDANGCRKDSFAVINSIPAGITYQLDISNPECGGDPGSIEILNLDGPNPPIMVNWSVPGASGLSASNLSAGEVSISFEDSRGCTADTSVVLINEDGSFQLTIDATPPDCAVGLDNGTISFPGFDSVNGVCEWGDPELNAQNCTLIGLAPGIYNVTLTDINGCQKDTFVDLQVSERLEIELTNIMDVSCFGLNNGFATASVVNNPLNAASLNFFWSNPDDDGTGLSDDASQLGSGTNTVYAFDGLCTSDTINFEINEPEQIRLNESISEINDVLCNGDCSGSVQLAAEGGTPGTSGYSFLWPDGFTGSGRSDLCAGLYEVSVTDENQCESVLDILVGEPEILLAEVDSSNTVLISCGNDNTGVLAINAEGGCGAYNFSWPGNISNGPVASMLSPGSYTVTVTDACDCSSTVSFTFDASVPISSEAIIPDMPLCAGDQVCIGIESVSGGTGQNYTYSINFGSRIPIDSCIMVGPGNYTLLVFDSAGCSDQLEVSVDSPPAFDVNLGDDITLDLGDNQTTVTAELIGGVSPFEYFWDSEADLECANQDCSTVNVSPFAFTPLSVLVNDANGCIAEDQINIDIKAERNVYLPNVFNPNSLPPNDKFMILTGRGVSEILSFRIFDRWGNLVFEKTNFPPTDNTEEGWDGRRGSQGNSEVEQGVYVYTAEIRFVDDVVINYSGEITVIR